ncbi:MAG TPA: histidine triad nucleotide-binding protein [Actinomycetota bacterium]|nr:histidine triad nucleotide-binding protein [Actinomycetota bacterium]
MTDCLFCRIVSGEIEADIVHEGAEVIAFRDINPQAPTHIQIIPRRHVPKVGGFVAEQDSAWLVELFSTAADLARAEGLEAGFRLVINNGPLAGQSVHHVHLHLLGGRQLGWPPG